MLISAQTWPLQRSRDDVIPTPEGTPATSISTSFHPITLHYPLHSIDYDLNVSCFLLLGCEYHSRSRASSGLFTALLQDWEPGLVTCGVRKMRIAFSVVIHWLLSPHLSSLFPMPFILQSLAQDPTTPETHISWLEVSPCPWRMSPQLLPYRSHKLFDARVHFLYITATHFTELICVWVHARKSTRKKNSHFRLITYEENKIN